MAFGKVFGVLVALSLAATGVSMARNISAGTAAEKGKAASHGKNEMGHSKSSAKPDKVAAKNAQGPANTRHAKPQAPIVMGRSAIVHHKTKVHHLKVSPIESGDMTASTGTAN